MRFCFSQSQRNCSKSFVLSLWVVWHLLRPGVTLVMVLLVNIALWHEFVSRIYSALFVIKGTHLWSTLQILVVCVFYIGVWLFPVILLLSIYLFSYFLPNCTPHFALFISRLDIFHSGFWAFRDGPLDDSLEGLKDRLKTTVLSSKANGTVMVYNRAFRRWKQFANDKLNGKAFPASPFHVALYLQHLIEETHSPSVVDSAFYGLKWAHDVAGIPSPTDDPIVEAVRTASKRVLGNSVLSRKEPIPL